MSIGISTAPTGARQEIRIPIWHQLDQGQRIIFVECVETNRRAF